MFGIDCSVLHVGSCKTENQGLKLACGEDVDRNKHNIMLNEAGCGDISCNLKASQSH